MDRKTTMNQLNNYHTIFERNRIFCAYKEAAIKASLYAHFVMVVLFFSFTPMVVDELYYGFRHLPLFKDLLSIFSPVTSTMGGLIFMGVLFMYAFPLLLGTAILVLGNHVEADVQPLNEKESPLDIAKKLNRSIEHNYECQGYWFYWKVGIVIIDIALTVFSTVGVCIANPPVEQVTYMGIGGYIWACIIGTPIFLAPIALIFRVIQSPLFSTSSEKWKVFRKAHNDCLELEKALVAEAEAKEKMRLKKEAEQERKKAEEEVERVRQGKLRIASEAEAQFQTLKNLENNKKLVEALADKGSPSACLYFGRILYQKFITEALTKSEKEKLAAQCKSYFKVSADTGNMEAKYLLLAIRTTTESNKLEAWLQYLNEAREIKKSGKLPEMYHDSLDGLINSLIEVVDRTEKMRKDAKREPVIKRKYCRFLVAGQCSHGGYMSSCRYINNPGSCSTALMEKGYAVEFE